MLQPPYIIVLLCIVTYISCNCSFSVCVAVSVCALLCWSVCPKPTNTSEDCGLGSQGLLSESLKRMLGYIDPQWITWQCVKPFKPHLMMDWESVKQCSVLPSPGSRPALNFWAGSATVLLLDGVGKHLPAHVVCGLFKSIAWVSLVKTVSWITRLPQPQDLSQLRIRVV